MEGALFNTVQCDLGCAVFVDVVRPAWLEHWGPCNDDHEYAKLSWAVARPAHVTHLASDSPYRWFAGQAFGVRLTVSPFVIGHSRTVQFLQKKRLRII